MPLTPQDIENQVFREKFKGYDQEQVDAFLDQVAADLMAVIRERDEALERMGRVEAEAAESVEAERLLKRTLVTAQRTADETVAEAEERAASLLGESEARAAEIVRDAEQRAAELVTQARQEAEERRAAAERELADVRRAVAELQRFRSEYHDRVRAVVAEQLAALDRAGDVPDVPAEIARLAAPWDAAGTGVDGGDS